MSERKYHITPPKWPLKLLRSFLKEEYLEEIEGDMEERFQDNLEIFSVGKARRLFAWDALKLMRPTLIKGIEINYGLNSYDMFKHYVIIGFRTILKYKAFSFINVFGLAVAMSVCMLIILMLSDQNSYDQFHENKSNLYRILIEPGDNNRAYATTPGPLANQLRTDFTIVRNAVRLRKGFGGDATYNQNYAEVRGYFSDPDFFKIFNFKLERGNRNTALDLPNTLVISHQIAEKLFGNEDPIGKVIDFSDRGIDMFTEEGHSPVYWGTYVVTGVFAKQAHKTHLKFDVLVSSSSLRQLYSENKIYDESTTWGDYSQNSTYVLTEKYASQEDLDSSLERLSNIQYQDHERLKNSLFKAQPITEITPGPVLGNDAMIGLPLFAYYILAGLAFVIMLSACLNYTNLSIARALTRSREIGVRKVSGANKRNLIFQFLGESVITSFLALILAIGLLLFVKTAFLNLWVNQELNFKMEFSGAVILNFILLALITGLIAGIFPALRFSSYESIKVLKNQIKGPLRGLGARKFLMIAQFIISLLFVITSIVGFNQFKHFMNYEYSFDATNVVNVNLQSNNYQNVINAFNDIPEVSQIASCAYLPGGGRNDGTTLKSFGEDEGKQVIDLSVDEGFIKTLDIDLIAGRNLINDSIKGKGDILVNEELMRNFGFESPTDIIGQTFETAGNQKLTVIGVVEDFTFSLLFLKQIDRPVILRYIPEKFNFVNLKLTTTDLTGTLAALEEKWETVDPIHPFKFDFFEEELKNRHKGVLDLVSTLGFFAFLAITIACLGLLGMAIYTTECRTKEIGVRKVFGANALNITFLLSREFLILLGISVTIAAPLSYFLNRLWLDFLVVRVEFGFEIVFLGSLILLLLGLLTIAPQTIKLSKRNPVDSLKQE